MEKGIHFRIREVSELIGNIFNIYYSVPVSEDGSIIDDPYVSEEELKIAFEKAIATARENGMK